MHWLLAFGLPFNFTNKIVANYSSVHEQKKQKQQQQQPEQQQQQQQQPKKQQQQNKKQKHCSAKISGMSCPL